MPNKKKHEGQREGAGPPREMAEPTRATITLEKSQLEQLKAKHGRNWQKVIRSLIAAHLHAAQQIAQPDA